MGLEDKYEQSENRWLGGREGRRGEVAWVDGVSNGGAEEKEVRMRGREKWYEEERMKRGGGG